MTDRPRAPGDWSKAPELTRPQREARSRMRSMTKWAAIAGRPVTEADAAEYGIPEDRRAEVVVELNRIRDLYAEGDRMGAWNEAEELGHRLAEELGGELGPTDFRAEAAEIVDRIRGGF